MQDREWLRGAITLGILMAFAGAMIASPVGAAFDPTKKKIKKIAKKQARKVVKGAIGGKQDRCADGALIAYAEFHYASMSTTDFSAAGVSPQFNCAGGPIEARNPAMGEFEVRIPGVTTGPGGASGVIASGASLDSNIVSYSGEPANDFLDVEVWDIDPPNPETDDFVLMVVNT